MTGASTSAFASDSLKQTLRREVRSSELSITATEVLSDDALRQIEQVVDGVFAGDRLRQHRVVIIGGIDKQKESSLWLTAGVASSLTARTGEVVHVLSIQGEGSDGTVIQIDPKGAMVKDCALERVSETMLSRNANGQSHLSTRLTALQATGRVVLIHVPNLQQQFDLLSSLSRIDGVVLFNSRCSYAEDGIKVFSKYFEQCSHTYLGRSVAGSCLSDSGETVPNALRITIYERRESQI